MEGNRRQSEAFLKHGRQQMLPSVLLHVVEPPWPVDAAVHVRIRRLSIDHVQNFIAFIPYVENVGVPNLSQIVRLPP